MRNGITGHSVVALAVASSLFVQGIMLTAVAESLPAVALSNVQDENTWLEISAANFENNLTTLRNRVLTGNTAMCAVMKADAYGHGIGLLMPSIIMLGIDRVCFANNSEARIAREKGFKGKLIRIRIPSAGTAALMRTLSELGAKHKRTIKVHFNLNSAGMSRNGLEVDTDIGKRDTQDILRLPNLEFTGIMTHFPDETVDGVQTGLKQFLAESQWIPDTGKLDRKRVTLHCANTYAAVNVPATHLDMVRVGSLLYGMGAPQVEGLKPVMAMKTRVGSVHNFKAGDTVIYDRTFTLKRDSQLANLAVGYSDGYNRSFSNRTQVLIHGKRFPVVGKITMNTVMVDVTGSDVQPGDEVVLLGTQGVETIPMSELMAASYTFYGEFFMNVGGSNPKVLAREGK
jgi:alanine racemase